MPVLFYIWVGSMVSVMIFGLVRTTETGAIILARLTGKKIILIEGVDSAIRGTVWKSPLNTTPITGIKTAYRYPSTKIGTVELNDDGTGEYCGKVLWKVI